jgi:CHAT domain-containing protein
LAEKLIFQTLGECGQGTAVVEYMYADDENLLFAYILRPGVDPLIHCHRTILKAFFQGKERTKMGTTLLALVTNTRTAIMKHQKSALVGLQILAELLVAPVRDHIWDCSNIIFAPHEILHSIPFCALHNKETFLIQEKTISLIPSVRALHQCFMQQQAFEVACRNETVGPAFVAGNPEPMGLGLDQLKGAAEEAEEVAELLNVEAILGGRVTKEAVIQGLSSACLVVLGTHGIVDPAHPHGALVLQGCKPLLSVSQKAASELNGDGSSSYY